MSAPDAEKVNRKAGSGLRGRHAECFIFAWTAGLLSAFFGAPAWILLLPAAMAAVLAVQKKIPRDRMLRLPLLLVCIGLCGGILSWTVYDRAVKQPLCALDGTSVTCTGTVTEREQLSGERARYTLRTRLSGHAAEIDWYAESGVPALKIGDRVTLDAELTRIPADYRYHTQSYQAGLGRYLRIYDADVLDIDADTGFSLRRTLRDYRTYIAGILRTRLSSDDAALLEAMLFGDTSFLSDGARSALYQTGIGHITAVSGLHLIFFAALMIRLLKRLRCSARQIFFGTAATILLFALTVDASVSVQRAGLMLLLSLGAGLCGRYGDALRSLALAMFACLVCTPYVIGSVSFWLSVSGTFGVCIAAPYMTEQLRCPRMLRQLAELCCIAVSVFPASVLLCGETSLLSPVCNLLIVPVSMAALYLGLIVVLTGGLAAFLLPAAGWLCRIVLTVAKAAARLPFSHLTVSAASVKTAVILCTILLLVMLMLRAKPREIGGAVLCAAILLSALTAAERIRANRELRIAVLGAEKQAVLVISRGGYVIAADLSGNARNAQYVRRYLSDFGLTHLDALVLQSPRSAAGYQQNLSAVTVDAVYVQSGTPWREDAEICGVMADFSEDALSLHTDDLAFSLSGGLLTVTANGVTAAAVPYRSAAADADIVIRWGGIPEVQDTAAIALCPAADGNNLLMRISPDGHAASSALA